VTRCVITRKTGEKQKGGRVEVTTKASYRFEDQQGTHARIDVFLPGVVMDPNNFGVTTIRDALKACSDGAFRDVSLEAMDREVIGEKTPGVYCNSEDKLCMHFHGVDSGEVCKYEFPSPLANIWLDDKETADPANASIIALISVIEENMKSKCGEVLVYSGRAYRLRGKRHIVQPIG
jgi:hypothetical protein